MASITPDAFNRLLQQHMPMVDDLGYRAEAIGDREATVRLHYSDALLRPGGTISGPAMMGLVDCAMYAALMGAIGPVALAVTTNLNINFLRKPEPVDIVANCRILKLGKRLAVLETTLYSDGADEPIAHATGTYSIPPA